MKDDIRKKTLEKLLEWAKEAEAIASEQAPIVAQEILRYEFYEGLVGFIVFGVLMSVLAGSCVHYYINRPFGRDYKNSEVSLICFLFSLIPGILFFHNFFTILQIKLAPRMFLIKYISNLM